MRGKTLSTIALLLVVLAFQSYSQVKKYYVDATGGSDANSGLSPSAAWKTIDKVNASTFAPGDSILFKRGEVFRGSLVPASGSPSGYITYSAYGTGNKPKLLGAYDRSSPSDWTNQGGNIWRTKYKSVNLVGSELLPNPDFSSDLSGWDKYDDPATGASTIFSRTTVAGEYFTAPGAGRLVCINHGNGTNPWNTDIQLSTGAGSIKALAWYRLSFMAKATRSFAVPENKITLHQYGPPWANYSSSVSPPVTITTQWTSNEIYFHVDTTASNSRIIFYLGSVMPNGDTLFIDALSFKECDANPEPLSVDVGNIILNNEQICGVKVWERSDLNSQGKFWYDEDNDLVEMYSVSNPGSYYSHVEFGLNRLCVLVDNRSFVACDNLDLCYGVFGVAGMSTHHIIIGNCDISFIGGEDQYGGSRTARYGNGVQFWNGAHDNVVERCTFNQIYDAAVTAQGDDPAGFEVYNIYFRNNVVRNSEYSFEFWEGGSLSRAHDIYFENNTCLNAGRGWGHAQRPDPNGTHLMFFPFFAQTTNVYIRNNIFFDATEQSVRWWRKEDINKVVLDHNCWYQSNGLLARIDLQEGIGVVNITYDYATQWEAYKAATTQDSHSIHSDPLLNSDRTLQALSPCIDAGITLSTVTDDFNRTARPQGTAYDIGAFEASATLLAPPTLLAPADGMKKVQIDPTLSWKKLPRALKYSVVVSLTPNFSNVIVLDTSLVDTSKAIGPLQYGTTYYWRVCAKNVGGTSDWSQTRSFTTIAATPPGPAYYVAPDGNDSNPGTESLPWKTLAKAASTATAGVTVFIKQGTYNERLVPVNSGTPAAPITFTSYPGDSVTISGVGIKFPSGQSGDKWWSGLIHIEGLMYIKISGLRVVNSEASGILVTESRHITIEKNYTDSTYSSGIVVNGCYDVAVDANEVARACTGHDQECISFMMTDLFEIKNNRVHDGLQEGIDVKVGSSNGTVCTNEVYNQTGRPPGIYIDAFSSHEFNIDVFDNISHDNGFGFDVGSEDGGLLQAIKIHHNKAYNNGRGLWVGGWGVAGVKHLFSNITIYGNEFYNNEVGLEIGGYTGTDIDSIKVFNNLIYRNKGVGVRITRYDGPTGDFAMRNVSVINNTIYGNGTVGNGWDADNGGINVFNISPVNMLILNNILSNNAVCTIYVSPEVLVGSLTLDYNFFDGFRNFVNEKAGTNAVYGIPLFVDSLRNDYHLRATSPCIDKGHPNQEYNDPRDSNKPGYALYPAQGTIRNDIGAYGGPYAGSSDVVVIAAPSAPTLAGPADGAKSVSITPTLSWERAMGAVTYRLQVSLESWFSTILVNDSTITETLKSIGLLQNGRTYFWRVNAKNEGGSSSWSQVRSFTTTVAAPLGSAYYVSPSGNDSNPGTESLPWKTLAKAGSAATAGVTVYIKQGIYRERLVPVNSGTADGPITFTSYPGDSVIITGVGMTPAPDWSDGLVYIRDLSYVKITGLRLLNSAHVGILVEVSSHITIEKNYVDSTYSPGIKVHASDNVTVDGNEVVHGCLGLEEECISVSATKILEIRNNRVHDGFTEGIDVKVGSSDGVVSNNEVYNQPVGRAGIYLDAWDSHEFNIDVFDNISHDNGHGITCGAEDNGLLEAVKIHNNRVYRNRSWGFFVGGMGIGQSHSIKDVELYANLCYENDVGLFITGFGATSIDSLNIHNNFIYRNAHVAVRASYDGSPRQYMRNMSIVNNTIHSNGTLGVGWEADNAGINIFDIAPENLLIRNNIISSNAFCTIFVLRVPAGSVIVDYNFFDGFRNTLYEMAGTNAVYGNPMFVDSLSNDFHLQLASSCIDGGSPSQTYNDPPDPGKPGYALSPARGTVRNDMGAYGGPFATSWDLATSMAKPQTPLPNSPADSARGVSTKPMLSWNMILGVDRYRVQLSTSASFGSKLVDDSMVTDCYRQVGPLQNNTTHFWRVSASNVAGTSSYSTVRTFTTAVASAVEQLDGAVPTEYALRQNYPNPFNPATTIQFALPQSSHVSLKVYDALGRELTTLVSQELNPGYFTIRWNATVPSGIYFYRLQAGGYVKTRKMLLLK
jgi:parallel beta-helix repeat protein